MSRNFDDDEKEQEKDKNSLMNNTPSLYPGILSNIHEDLLRQDKITYSL